MRNLVGERIRSARKRLGLTQKEFSGESGIPLPTIKAWETGKRSPEVEGMSALVRVGINANWLLNHNPPVLLTDSSHDLPSGWDANLMQQVIEGVEVALEEMDREMAPDAKAKMIVSIYDLYADTGAKPVLGKIIKFVKSAAQQGAIMDGDDRKKAEIIDFLTANFRRKGGGNGRPPVRVSGNQNVVGNHNTIVHTYRIVNKTINRISPDDRYITPTQARKIQKQVARLVDIDVAAGIRGGDRKRLFPMWWNMVQDHFDVPTYREIPRHMGDEVPAWLTQKAAIKHPQLRRSDTRAWRNEHYRAIWARQKEMGLAKGDVYCFVFDRIGKRVTSLNSLVSRI